MLWRGRRQSDNIQDSRGSGGGRGMPGGGGFGRNPIRIPVGGRAGGGGLSGIIILVVLFFALRACGIDPLVGESGRVIQGAFGRAGLAWNQCLIANICQFRPNERNDFAALDWNEPAVQQGIAQLRLDLEKCRPTMVLCLGNEALHLFKRGNVSPPL